MRAAVDNGVAAGLLKEIDDCHRGNSQGEAEDGPAQPAQGEECHDKVEVRRPQKGDCPSLILQKIPFFQLRLDIAVRYHHDHLKAGF